MHAENSLVLQATSATCDLPVSLCLKNSDVCTRRSTSDRLVPCHLVVAVKFGHEPSVWTLGPKLDDDEQGEDWVGP